MTPIQEVAQSIAARAKAALFNTLKERRFTTTARILGEEKAKDAKVKVINSKGAPVAWWNSKDREIVLNDAIPSTKNAKLTLIYERAKLFHELFHLLFTTNDALRGKLHATSRKPDRYLWISNALEDGRIEYHGGKLYEGTTWYIRAILKALMTQKTPDTGLLIYVRTKTWRNAAEAKFWSKYEAQINEAITADSSDTVWQVAWDMVEDMEKKPEPPKPVCRCPDCGAAMPAGAVHLLHMAMSVCPTCGAVQTSGTGEGTSEGEGSGEGEDSDSGGEGEGESNNGGGEGEDSESGSETTEGEDGNTEGSESNEDDGGDASGEGEGQGSSEDAEGEENGSGGNATPSEPPTENKLDKDAARKIKEMIKDAMDRIDQEVEDELVELQEELATYQQEQQYLDASEEDAAGQLTELFSSILVESARQKFAPCEQGGMLDPQRLVATQTGGEYMREEIEKLSQPHIVLLVDESCSMQSIAPVVSAAARVINGAVQSCGAKSIAISFGGREGIHSCACVPLEGFKCDGWNTPTGRGLKAAHDWLASEDAVRGMVIVLTDGDPSNHLHAELEFESLRNDGFYVLNVLLGALGEHAVDADQRRMSHDWVAIKNPADLVRTLEVPLDNFISGVI